MMENLTSMNPMATMPGFDALRRQQAAFIRTMMGGWTHGSGPAPEDEGTGKPAGKDQSDDIAAMKKQLAEMQAKLSKL
jgi:polyhydroxyalkanoate synthesis regulator protein